jgi:hypothetical protein
MTAHIMTRAAMAQALLADAPALEAMTRHIIGKLWEHPIDAAQMRAALREAVEALLPKTKEDAE